jgi:putative addiction module component (TIGR02574 family)
MAFGWPRKIGNVSRCPGGRLVREPSQRIHSVFNHRFPDGHGFGIVESESSEQSVVTFLKMRSSLPRLAWTHEFASASFSTVSTQQLKQEAMALPLSERVSLAQALWESIDAGLADTDQQAAVREAIRRDQELSSGAAVGRTHEQVMQAARRAMGCD